MELVIQNIEKIYSNGVKALQDVSLNVGQGMFGLLGPNGAGKSSLMRTLATLQEPDSGEIKFCGSNVLDDKQAFRHQLGYLPQDFGVYPNASAQNLLDYFARLKGVSDPVERKAHVEHLLEMVNLTRARDLNVDTFSGGMRQRFGIAQALIGNPKVIIVDEPTAGLDPAERNRFYGVLHRIGGQAIVLLSTHIVGDVTNLCRDMAILAGGRILTRGEPKNLVREIDGQIWQKSVTREELDGLEKDFKVISTRLHEGDIKVLIQSVDEPGDQFVPKKPDLEDVYFSHIPDIAI